MRPQKVGETAEYLEKKRETPIQTKLETTPDPVEVIGSGDELVTTN